MKQKLNSILIGSIIGMTILFMYLMLSNIKEHRLQLENDTSVAVAQLIDNSKKNRARLDVSLCIFSVSPTRRTPEYVKSCYDQIEKQYKIKIQRFGDGIE